MDELEKLEHLSLVSKVCTELDNHLGLNDKDLAEFIIALAEKHPNFDEFKAVMLENGGEFSDSLIANLLRLIKHMKSASSKTSNVNMAEVKKAASKPEIEKKKELFPFLAIPDDPKTRTMLAEEIKPTQQDVEEADDLMAELEAMAPKEGPSHSGTETKPSHERAKRSRSRDRKRSRSRERKRRSRYVQELLVPKFCPSPSFHSS